MTATPEPHHARVPVLDAVRGLAICLVLAVHLTPDYLMPNRALEWMKKAVFTGWTGVDLFFVLSGYLITGILLRARDRPGFLRTFYLRRALRILPLYLGALAVVFGVLPWFVPRGVDPAFDRLRELQGWYWTHCANLVVLLHSFAVTTTHTVDLGHLWSLAVEEHFYLLWPFLVWRLPEAKLAPVLLGLIGLSLALRIAALFVLTEPMLTGAYVQTPLRLDGLAGGALVCVLFRRCEPATLRRGAGVIGGVGVAILLAVFFWQKGLWVGSSFIRTIGFTLLAAIDSSLLILVLTARPESRPLRLFNNPVLRFFGKYSYGLYVIHLLILPELDRWLPKGEVLARVPSYVASSAICLLGKTAVCVVLALMSWHVLEAPFLRLKERVC